MDFHGLNSGKNQERARFSSCRDGESGSILIWIFIAIGLFAALSWAMSMNSRSGETTVSGEKASLIATEIINYGSGIRNAVHGLLINGCEDTQISFSSADPYDYTNPNAPPDESCHVFKPNGGGINYVTFENLMAADGADEGWIKFYFHGADQIFKVGQDCADASCSELIGSVWGLSENTCTQINEKLGISNPGGAPPEENDMDGDPAFKGAYDYVASQVTGDDAPQLSGAPAACFFTDPCGSIDSCYVFYQVLIAR